MVMVLDFDSPVLHHHAHPAAHVISHILGRGYMVAALAVNLIPIVSRRIQTAVPVCLFRIDPVTALLGGNLKARAVKQIKLKFRPDHHPVRDASFLHIFYCTQAHILRILVKGLIFPFPDRAYIAAHGQGGNRCERIYISRICVRQKYHIALLNRRVSIIRTVKPDPVNKHILIKPLYGNRDMPPPPINIRHFKINHANLFLFAQFPDCLTLHNFYLLLFNGYRPALSFFCQKLFVGLKLGCRYLDHGPPADALESLRSHLL